MRRCSYELMGAVRMSLMPRESPDSADSDRFLRWQDITRRSLDFVNNTLIVLTSSLIAVVLNEAANASTVAGLHRWQLVCAGTAVVLLGVSVTVGVFTAANRLQSGRLTARRLRIGMLYRGMLSADRTAYQKIASAFRSAENAFVSAAGAWRGIGSGDRAEQAQAYADQAGDHATRAEATADALQMPDTDRTEYVAGRSHIADLARQAAEQARHAGKEAAEASTNQETGYGYATQQTAIQADSAAKTADQVAREPVTRWEERALARLIRNLAGLESVTRRTIRSAAEGCLTEDRVSWNDEAIEGLQLALRDWSDQADNRTWWLIRIQLWTFLLGSAFFAAVPIWILLSAS